MSAHLFPISLCALKIKFSSSSEIGAFWRLGLRWLCHLSLHCFPDLPFILYSSASFLATNVHLFNPYFLISTWIALSSYLLNLLSPHSSKVKRFVIYESFWFFSFGFARRISYRIRLILQYFSLLAMKLYIIVWFLSLDHYIIFNQRGIK